MARKGAGDEARLLSLLSVAYGFAVPAKVLKHLAWAETEFERGDLAKSAMHVALTGLSAFAGRENARRLHIAAGILDFGLLTPTALLKGCGLDSREVEALAKYFEDQPRLPAGNPGGGQWTRDGEQNSGHRPARRENDSQNDVALVLPDGCEEEWAEAIRFCADLLKSPSPPKGLTGGYKTVRGCAKGFVSQRCGGNRI